MIAVGICRASVDQHERWQVFGFKLPRWIHQHAFYGGTVVGFPAVRLAFGQIAFGEEVIEGCDRLGFLYFFDAIGQVNFRRFFQRRVNESDFWGALRRRNPLVRPRPRIQFGKGVRRPVRGVHRHFGPEPARDDNTAADNCVPIHGSDEIFAPLLHLAVVRVDPVKMWLQIAVGNTDVPDRNSEKQAPIIISPVQVAFNSVVACELAWGLVSRRIGQVNRVDFIFLHLLLPLRNRLRVEG